jgi:hypothetical protein
MRKYISKHKTWRVLMVNGKTIVGMIEWAEKHHVNVRFKTLSPKSQLNPNKI